MPDLNDLAFFAAVVEHQGFAAASRALKIPKSSLSRRVAALEEALGARLLQRTTRQLTLTAVGAPGSTGLTVKLRLTWVAGR